MTDLLSGIPPVLNRGGHCFPAMAIASILQERVRRAARP